MSRLMVIVVPPNFAAKKADGYHVVLGDCVLPGFTLWTGWDLVEANRQCESFASHYQVQGVPMSEDQSELTTPRRVVLRLIQGGAS